MRRHGASLVVLALVASVLPGLVGTAQAAASGPASTGFVRLAGTPDRRVWLDSGRTAPARTSRPKGSLRTAASPRTATFDVSYSGFTAQQQAAFQRAVDLWSRIVVSPVPIVIDARLSSLPPGVLGSAGPTRAYRRDGSLYAVALANAQSGRDLAPGVADIEVDFSNSSSLIYYGTDDAPPRGTFDFTTIVLHELAHGLGFLGDLDVVNGLGTYDEGSSQPTPFLFDRKMVERTSGGDVPVLSRPRNSVALAQALTSQAVYFDGRAATTGGGGSKARIYAPPRWEEGSSLGHLDEDSYPTGDPNALMTPQADRQEIIRDPGPVARGILKDIGWQLSPGADPELAPPTAPAPPAPSPQAPSPQASSPQAPAPSAPSPQAPAPAAPASPLPVQAPVTVPVPPVTTPDQPSVTNNGSRYTPVAPRRVLDTRDGTGTRRGSVGAGEDITLSLTSAGVPASARAVVLNVTAVGASASTDVRAYPTGPVPQTSNLNLGRGQTRANLVTVSVGGDGVVHLRNAAGSVHLLADLAGFYAPDAETGYFPVAPSRLLDTRPGGRRVTGGDVVVLPVAGSAGIPASARAVVLAVTAVGATRGTDVRVYPDAAGAVPEVSTLNAGPGGPVPNLVVVPLSNSGAVRLRNAAGSVDLLADVYGYFSSAPGGALFRPLPPTRLLDTRPQRLGSRAFLDVETVTSQIPPAATAVALNVTGIGAGGGTDVRLFPSPRQAVSDPPTVSTLNLVRGQTVAGAAVVPVASGAVRVYNSGGSLGIAVDVAGWFGPA